MKETIQPKIQPQVEDIINDQVRDIAISIVDELVNEGIVKDCTDTDCEAEFICQDIIVEHLLNDKAKPFLAQLSKAEYFGEAIACPPKERKHNG